MGREVDAHYSFPVVEHHVAETRAPRNSGVVDETLHAVPERVRELSHEGPLFE
jgi:hypothetical protein